MTDMVFAVIDNHRIKKGTTYKFIYKTRNPEEYVRFLKEKGLI